MLYIARKDNIQFYIQPDMIEDYAQLGYTIIKLEEVIVKDVKKEAQAISLKMGVPIQQI